MPKQCKASCKRKLGGHTARVTMRKGVPVRMQHYLGGRWPTTPASATPASKATERTGTQQVPTTARTS